MRGMLVVTFKAWAMRARWDCHMQGLGYEGHVGYHLPGLGYEGYHLQGLGYAEHAWAWVIRGMLGLSIAGLGL
jgi:hypothetical protein